MGQKGQEIDYAVSVANADHKDDDDDQIFPAYLKYDMIKACLRDAPQ